MRFFFIVLLLFIISSCTIEKRLHLKGYHISNQKFKIFNFNESNIPKQSENLSLKNQNDNQEYNNILSEEVINQENEVNSGVKEVEVDSKQNFQDETDSLINNLPIRNHPEKITKKTNKNIADENIIIQQKKIKRLNIISFATFTIGSFLIALTGISFLMGITTVILSLINFKKCRLLNQRKNKLSIILFILGILMIAAPWIILIWRPGEFLIELEVYGFGVLMGW
jgi:membrane-associated HD superfamily phosphohydrolase